MPYPVSVAVELQATSRNRLTTFVRPILAIPHAILVGPFYWWSRAGAAGLLGAAASVLAIVSWFTLLVSGEHSPGIRDFSRYYLRWRTRALAYMALFADAYPPFGDGASPASIDLPDPALPRGRASIAVRLRLAVPHLLVLAFPILAWFVTTVIAWVAILATGAYPASLAPFGIGAMRWMLRGEASLLLLADEYPPFALN